MKRYECIRPTAESSDFDHHRAAGATKSTMAKGNAELPASRELAKPGPGWLLGSHTDRIDILTWIDGVDFRRAWERRVHAKLACP